MTTPEMIRQLAQASAAAYGLEPGGNSADYLKAAGITLLTLLRDPNDTVRGFVGKLGEHTVISIKGTASLQDLFLDADLLMRPYMGCFVHEGFLREHSSMIKRLDKVDLKGSIYITGHSLGGAVATILGLTLTKVCPTLQISVVTFGSPRVGDHAFVELFNATMKDSARVVHALDLVPRIPKLDYDHVKGLLHLTDKGKVIGRVHGFFRKFFTWVKVAIADLDEQALRNHHVDTYVKATFLHEVICQTHSAKR